MTTGGAERVALNLSSGFVSRGHEVDLVLVNATGDLLREVPGDVNVVDLSARRVLTSFQPLRAYLSQHEPDIVYSMMTEPNLIALGAHRSVRNETSLVISEHNTLSVKAESVKDKLVMQCAKIAYPAAKHLVAVSEGVRDDLLEQTRVSTEQITVIYNPVDIESIRSQAAESPSHDWIQDESISVILAGGRHEPQKEFDTLLRAFARIERPELRLILFGRGGQTEALKDLSADLGLRDRVAFPGFVNNPFGYMGGADVFVLSSRYEGFGLVLIEAMACGCPVVSTDCESGPREILNDGEYGPLVSVGDSREIAEAIEETLDNPLSSQMLRRRAEAFDIEHAVDEYCSLFASVHGKVNRPPGAQ